MIKRDTSEKHLQHVNKHGTKAYYNFQEFLKEHLDNEETCNLIFKIAVYKKNIDVVFDKIFKDIDDKDSFAQEFVNQIRQNTPKKLIHPISPRPPQLPDALEYEKSSAKANTFALPLITFLGKELHTKTYLEVLISITVFSTIIDLLFNELEDNAPLDMKDILREGYNLINVKIQMTHINGNKEQFKKDFES